MRAVARARAPSARRARAAELQGHRAGFVSRVMAGAIDLAALLAILLGALVLVSAVRFAVLGPPFVVVSAPPAVEGPAFFAVGVVYLSYFWGTTGRTPGKQVLGLRVVDAAERRLRAWQAVVRAVLCLLFPAGLVWALVSRRRASVQDLVVRSVVEYDWAYRPVRR